MYAQVLSHVRLFLTHGLYLTRLHYPWDFPGKNTGVCCYFLSRVSSYPRTALASPAIAGGFFPLSYLESPYMYVCIAIHHTHTHKIYINKMGYSVQFSSVTQSCPTLCNPMNRSTPGLPVHHQLPEFTQTQVH